MDRCSACQRQLPADYVDYHSGWLSAFRSPAIVTVIGFSGHGKTVYLASLYYTLQNLAPRAWQEFFRQGLTLKTLKVLYDNLGLLKRGKMPDPTISFPEPNIDRLHKVPKFGDRTLLIYDPPGESFELDKFDDAIKEYAGFVKQSPCALFLVSMTDMMKQFDSEDAVADEMHRLLETYNVGMKNLGVRGKTQHLIVVYTKADRLLSHYSFPVEVIKCLESSDVDGLGDIPSYMLGMKRNSQLLKDFTAESLNARNFLANARTNFKTVEFCAVSALGSEPVDERLIERITPRRVIDPLLWVLDKS
jgi:hypothetical protein